MYFSVYYINYGFSTNIECPEAMIGDCLKSDNFHMEIIMNNLTCEIISFISARNPYKALHFI